VHVIVDSSALVAIVMAEPPAAQLFKTLVRAPVVGVGAPSLLETSIVLDGRLATVRHDSAASLALLVARLEIEVLPFGAEHWPVAWAAFLRFGKGRHAASLNLGDCLTYAVAKLARRPLLCVGSDFGQTDLELVELSE
jgi:ribonuclease VapC